MNTLLKFHLKNFFKNSILSFLIIILAISILFMTLGKGLKLTNLYFNLSLIIFSILPTYIIENYFFFIQNGCTRKVILSSLIKLSISISLFFILLEGSLNVLLINVMNLDYMITVSPLYSLLIDNTSVVNIIIYIVLSFISYLITTLLSIAAGLYKLKVPIFLFIATIVFFITSPIILFMSILYIGKLDIFEYMLEKITYLSNNIYSLLLLDFMIETVLCLIILAIIVFLNKKVRK